MGDEVALVVHEREIHAFRQSLAQLVQRLADFEGGAKHVSGGLLDHPQAHVLVALMAGQPAPEGRAFAYFGHIADLDYSSMSVEGEVADFFRTGRKAAHGHEPALVLDLHDTRSGVLGSTLHGFSHLIQAHALEAHALGVDGHLELTFLAPHAFHAGDARHRLKTWNQHFFREVPQSHGIHGGTFQHDLLDLLEASGGAGHQG